MTTIVYRDGIMASDSRSTAESEAGGSRVFKCVKMYEKIVPGEGRVVIGTAGEGYPALLFVDWYGTGKEPPGTLIDGDADFTCIVLSKRGLWEYDKWCRGEKVIGKFYAIGSGAKAALGALHMGANAAQSVRVACKIDPYSAGPIRTMRLK